MQTDFLLFVCLFLQKMATSPEAARARQVRVCGWVRGLNPPLPPLFSAQKCPWDGKSTLKGCLSVLMPSLSLLPHPPSRRDSFTRLVCSAEFLFNLGRDFLFCVCVGGVHSTCKTVFSNSKTEILVMPSCRFSPNKHARAIKTLKRTDSKG